MLMGGVVSLLEGDFRRRFRLFSTAVGRRQSLPIWELITSSQLATNMSVQLSNDQESGFYVQYLFEIGESHVAAVAKGLIKFESHFCNVLSPEDNLINYVFPRFHENSSNGEYLCERDVMAPKNESMGNDNTKTIAQLPGGVTTSIDTMVARDDTIHIPKPLELSGMPTHKLVL
ncbi:uncharacterized protein LOC124606359 [Schistocerca americana]|uniref:uncharacterized protein LOC124606359 n=1 Tax=Schistocerca americana TaxID=7009 RepID=UPI001F4FA03A|nr:uncharacterized protein LOC124606359 [Schistocerca americana]